MGETIVREDMVYDPDFLSPDEHTAIGDGTPHHKVFSLRASRRSNSVVDQYLRCDGVPTNMVPFIVPVDVELWGISASGRVADTWRAQVHNGGVLLAGADLLINAATSGYMTGLSISLPAGSPVELYINSGGSGVSFPRIEAWFRKKA